MQDFINRDALERAAAEVWFGPRAHYYASGLVALVLAASAGLPLAAIWLGLMLLTDEAHGALSTLLERCSRARLALDLTRASARAGAPALAWFAGGEFGAAAALAMLCWFAVQAALDARRGRQHALLACLPYTFLGAILIAASASAATLAALVLAAFTGAAAISQAHRNSHARAQDAEWVRQLNMQFSEPGQAAWEIDYEHQRVFGAANLAGVLGRPVRFEDIANKACFATAADKAVDEAAFAPVYGPARRIAIEHDETGAGGAVTRVRHNGFLHTAPDGAPTRLTCVTTRVGLRQAAAPAAPRVVVIAAADDDAVAIAALARAGLDAHAGGSGEAGFAALRAQIPALIVLDISFESDWCVLHGLKHDAALRDVPVMVLAEGDQRARAMGEGAADYLAKPVNSGLLVAASLRYARAQSALPEPAPAQQPDRRLTA